MLIGSTGFCATRKRQYADHSPSEGVKDTGLGVAFNEKSGMQVVFGYSVTEEFGDKQVGVYVNS